MPLQSVTGHGTLHQIGKEGLKVHSYVLRFMFQKENYAPASDMACFSQSSLMEPNKPLKKIIRALNEVTCAQKVVNNLGSS